MRPPETTTPVPKLYNVQTRSLGLVAAVVAMAAAVAVAVAVAVCVSNNNVRSMLATRRASQEVTPQARVSSVS
jgi:hypothetical protein